MTAAASRSVRIDLSLNSSQIAISQSQTESSGQSAGGKQRAVRETRGFPAAGGGWPAMHLLALRWLSMFVRQIGRALLGQQVFVDGLRIVVVAGELLVLLLDRPGSSPCGSGKG